MLESAANKKHSKIPQSTRNKSTHEIRILTFKELVFNIFKLE